MNSTSRVLYIPELLESILQHLPINDLFLRAPLVSHFWKSTIEDSPSISQKLFRKPLSSSGSAKTGISLNPLLSVAFSPFFPSSEPVERRQTRHQKQNLPSSETLRNHQAAECRLSTEAHTRAEASWRNLLVAQPPLQHVSITYICRTELGMSMCEGRIECDDGLRMGLLYDLVESHAGFPVSEIELEWPDEEGRELMVQFEARVQGGRVEDRGRGTEYRSKGYRMVDVKFGEMVFMEGGDHA